MVAVLRNDIMRFMMTERIMPRIWMHQRSMHQLPREGQCTVPKRLAKYGWWKCQQSNTYISTKNSCTYYGNSQSNQEVHKETSTPWRSVWGFGYPCASSTHGT